MRRGAVVKSKGMLTALAIALALMAGAVAGALPGKAFATFPAYDTATEFTVSSDTPVTADVDKVLWYKVTPEQDGGLKLILNNNATSPANATAWFANGTAASNELLYSELSIAGHGGYQVCETGVKAGADYYLAVQVSAGANLTLQATFDEVGAYEFEPNNAKETASSLAFDKPTTTGTFALAEGATEDVDWYTFAVAQISTLQLNYKGANNSSPVFDQAYDRDSRTITLYGSDGSTVLSSVDYLAADESSGKDLVQGMITPGTYYVKVEKYSEVSDPAPGKYTIRPELSVLGFTTQPASTYHVAKGATATVTWDTNFAPTAIWVQVGSNNKSRWEGSKTSVELEANNENAYKIRAFWGTEWTDEYIESDPFTVIVLDLGANSLYLREGATTLNEDTWLPAFRLLAKANNVTAPSSADGVGNYDLNGDGSLDMKVEKEGASDYKLTQLDTCSIASDYEITLSDAAKAELEAAGEYYWSGATYEPFIDYNIGEPLTLDLASGNVEYANWSKYSPLGVFLDSAVNSGLIAVDNGVGVDRYDLDKNGAYDVKVTTDGTKYVVSTDADTNLTDTTILKLNAEGLDAAQHYLTDFYDAVIFKMNPAATEPSKIEYDPAKGTATWEGGKLTVTPADGFEVDEVKVNGTVVSPDSEGKYAAAAGDIVEITFKPVVPTEPTITTDPTNPGTTPGADTPATPVAKPKATTLGKLTAAKKGFSVKWKKRSGINGYQFQYSLKKTFKPKKSVKSVTVNKAKKTSAKVKKLKSKKTYYVRIRTFAKTSNGKVYSAWSKTKKVTTK